MNARYAHFSDAWQADLAAQDIQDILSHRQLDILPAFAQRLATEWRGLVDRSTTGTGLMSLACWNCERAMGRDPDDASLGVWRLLPPEAFCEWIIEPILRDCYRHGTDPTTMDIEQAFDDRLTDVTIMGDDFWFQAAMGLYGAAAHHQHVLLGVRSRASAPPEPDLRLLRLLFSVEPRISAPARAAFTQTRADQLSPNRSAMRPPQGGVVGIRQSHRIEDMPDALVSELALPPIALASKLTGEGFLVRHRPPRSSPRRDLLILTIAEEPLHSDTALVAKAGWVDAVLRTWPRLIAAGLNATDIVWMAPVSGGVNAATIRLDKLVDAPDFGSLSVRPGRLLSSGLLPDIADLLPNGTDGGTDPANMIAHGLDLLQARSPLSDVAINATITPETYSSIMLLVIAGRPADDIAEQAVHWPREHVRIATRYRLSTHPALHVARLSLPGTTSDEAAFRIDAGRSRHATFVRLRDPGDVDDTDRLARLVGQISDEIRHLIRKAADGG